MPHFDMTINVPSLLSMLGALWIMGVKVFSFTTKMTEKFSVMSHKIDTMWEQFLIEHPEYERRKAIIRN